MGEEHESRGHECRTVTFFRSPKNFHEDICLDLPFNFTKPLLARLRNYVYSYYRGEHGYFKIKEGIPPLWKPEGLIDEIFLNVKDWIWRPIVNKAIQDHNLLDFDIIHFESGMDFLKDEFFVQEMSKRQKKIICHYHGEDLRSRGVMPIINSKSDLNLTNEVDLLSKHPNINYLFLPFKTNSFATKTRINNRIRVAHAPTNRFYKGSDKIISVCKKLELENLIKFDLIEGFPHNVALKKKMEADIFIDQIGDLGGWGYGMNSVESLSMGICTLTEMNSVYNSFIPDHPFVSINSNSLENVIRNLISEPEKIFDIGQLGKKWVQKYHDVKSVSESLYSFYRSIGVEC